MARPPKTYTKEISQSEQITINDYLSNFSKKRNLDQVFINWFHRKDAKNPRKTKIEWDNLLKLFYEESH